MKRNTSRREFLKTSAVAGRTLEGCEPFAEPQLVRVVAITRVHDAVRRPDRVYERATLIDRRRNRCAVRFLLRLAVNGLRREADRYVLH